MKRSELLERLADLITAVQRPHPVRVGIDGVDGAGKTMLADELVAPIQRRGRPVVRSSVDFFHRPRAQRYQRGRHSPEGYFLDSFDYGGLKAALLNPLGPAGSRRFCRRLFDHRTDLPVDAVEEQADAEAVLLFDGIFLHRPELLECWDFTVFVDARFEVSVSRCAQRDGSSPDLAAAQNQRYIRGQEIYLERCVPRSRATVVVDNNDLTQPSLRAGAGRMAR